MNAVPFEIRQRMVRFRNSYIKAGLGHCVLLPSHQAFYIPKGWRLFNLELSAAWMQLLSRHGWLYGVPSSPTKSYFMHSKGVSVCPLKPDTAWMRCRSPHGWVYGVFRRAYTHALSKRHKKSAPKCAFLYLVLLSLD